ncbi:MAG: BamA/TamA family outer membrane protein [Chitinophagales bacterium]
MQFFRLLFSLYIPLLICSLCSTTVYVSAQDQTTEESPSKRKDQLLAVPIISYSPETNFVFGALGGYYFDLAQGDTAARMSQIQLITAYSTNGQLNFRPGWELITKNENYIFRGKISIARFPDKNYGIGNEADVLLIDFEDGASETLNYLRYTVDRYSLQSSFLKKIAPHFYAGLQVELENVYNYKPLADSLQYLSAQNEIEQLPIAGFRIGAGFNVSYDSRTNTLNPLDGSFVELRTVLFGKWLGSDYQYNSISLDARKYINTINDHTLALQLFINHNYPQNGSKIPLRGLAQLGGTDLIRGYRKGTFQDNSLSAAQIEYRMPIWKFIGIVGFAGIGQVYEKPSDWQLDRFKTGVGGGVRFMISKRQRINFRIDYALGLDQNSDVGKAQSGFYLFVGEAF